MKIKKDNKEINIRNIRKVKRIGKIRGLMFYRREKADSLLFEFKKPTLLKIHSCFVFFPFVAIWLDNKNNVLGIREVKPFRLNVGINKPFFRLVEIPINKRNRSILRISRR